MELDNNAHSVFLLYYHLVLVIKYRRNVITDPISNRAKEIFKYIAPNYAITLMEYYEKMKKQLNNTPAQYKEEFPFLKEVDSLALANAGTGWTGMSMQQSISGKKGNGFWPDKNKRNRGHTGIAC